jgi:hypothetical protein
MTFRCHVLRKGIVVLNVFAEIIEEIYKDGRIGRRGKR